METGVWVQLPLLWKDLEKQDGRILKSRMVNELHDNSQSLLIQSRQPQSVSRLYINFQLCPERHVLL